MYKSLGLSNETVEGVYYSHLSICRITYTWKYRN